MDRYKTSAKGRRTRLCKGKEDTCLKEPKKNGLCLGCISGHDRTQFLNRENGEIFIMGGIRYKRVGEQSRKLCTADNCESIAERKGLCVGHANDSKRLKNAKDYKGKIIINNGKRCTHNGVQMVQICDYVYEDNTHCDQVRVKDGKCKKHSPEWLCKFTGYKCTNIRIFGNYCQSHQNNVDNPREKSAGEAKIAEYLTSKGILYEQNYYMQHKGNSYYLDFYIPGQKISIEYDGRQHFNSVKIWGGARGLSERIYADYLKDKMCVDKGIRLLRIADTDDTHMNTYIDKFINETDEMLVGTPFYRFFSRPYRTIFP